MYRRENSIPTKVKNMLPALWDWCYHRFYWDELYMFITHKIIFNSVCRPIAWFDRHIIDGTMDMFATVTNKTSWAIRSLQSGQIQSYVLIYLLGAIILGVITVMAVM